METKLNVLAPANAISRNIKTKSDVLKIFRPLDEYSNFVRLPDQVRREESQDILRAEVKDILLEQIDCVIPRHWVYRRCVRFNETYSSDIGWTTITWRYTPSLDVIEMELYRIMRRLRHDGIDTVDKD